MEIRGTCSPYFHMSDEELVRSIAVRMRLDPDERWRRFKALKEFYAATVELNEQERLKKYGKSGGVRNGHVRMDDDTEEVNHDD